MFCNGKRGRGLLRGLAGSDPKLRGVRTIPGPESRPFGCAQGRLWGTRQGSRRYPIPHLSDKSAGLLKFFRCAQIILFEHVLDPPRAFLAF